MKLLSLCLFLLMTAALFAQSTGSISGVVKTSDGNPAEFVTIRLDGTGKGVVAGKNGAYEIRNVLPGGYTLTVSFVGLETQHQTVQITAGQRTQVDFEIRESSEQLHEIVVTANRLITESVYVSKMPLKNI